MEYPRILTKRAVTVILPFSALLCVLFCGLTASHAAGQTAQPPASRSSRPAPAAPAPAVSSTERMEPRVTVDASGVDPETGIPYYEEIREDWSSLQVGTSELRPEPPIVTIPDDAEKFTRTLVALKWRPGDALDVYVILPKGVKKPPAVLYLYNYSDDTERFKNDGWCRRVTSGGVAAIGFVSALSGQRFHDRPMKQWFVSELQESIGSTVHDVKFILDYLASRGDIDMDRIGMFGQGSGATIALLAAAADSRIKAVDALDPWGDWPDWLAKSVVGADDPEHDNRLKPAFLSGVAPLDPVQWLPKVQAPYIRIQQNMQDGATPRACKDQIKAAAPPRTVFKRFDTTTAFMNDQGRGMLFDWIKDALDKPAPLTLPLQKNAAVASGSGAATDGKNPVQR
jgi:dienelactone hydrolase